MPSRVESESPTQTLFVTLRPTAEVTIKSRTTRATFLRKLRLASKDALQRAGLEARVFVRGNRVMAEVSGRDGAEPSVETAAAALGRVFGIGTFSFVEAVAAPALDTIVEQGKRLYAERGRGERHLQPAVGLKMVQLIAGDGFSGYGKAAAVCLAGNVLG